MDPKEFDSIKSDNQKHDNTMQLQGNGNKIKMIENCKYYGTGYCQRQPSAYGKTCCSCGNTNHFKAVCKAMQGQRQG